MKAEIYLLYPELETAPDTDEVKNQLIQAAKEAWMLLDQETLNNVATSLAVKHL